MNTERLVTKLEKLQSNRGFSSRVLGKKVGVGKSTINRWFSFETIPSEVGAKKITRFLKRVK